MARTKMVFEVFLPTTSMARVNDAVQAVAEALNANRGEDMFVTYSGPHPNSVTEKNDERQDGERVGRGSQGKGKASSDDSDGSDDTGTGSAGKPRGRGRPKGSGKAAEGRGRERDEDGSDAEDARGNEPVRTRKGADEGADGGEERQRGSGRGRDDQRGNREAARISTGDDRGEADDDVPEFLQKERGGKKSSAGRDDRRDNSDDDGWGDEDNGTDEVEEDDPRFEAAKSKSPWPNELLPCKPGEIDKTTITTLLGEHFTAAGGKDRQITFDVMEEVTGQRAIKDVDERDYVKLAKALMKDAARYEFGLNK